MSNIITDADYNDYQELLHDAHDERRCPRHPHTITSFGFDDPLDNVCSDCEAQLDTCSWQDPDDEVWS